ncbi:MAG: hypothetical protein JXR03_21050 [Cyclobacteriaceae bacterium]
MKRIFVISLACMISLQLVAQDKQKKKFKVPKMNLGEKLGNLTGNLLTGKAEELDLASAKVSFICGIYPPEIVTSESKYFPEGTREGDYFAAITFTKNEGVGMLEIVGEVTSGDKAMDYVGLGSYGKSFRNPPKGPVDINIKTTTGDEASFSLSGIPGVEIISINGEKALPILDLDEDIELEYYNPAGSEGTRIRVSMITDVMGARALNHFADFEVKESGNVKVTIPKEALANPEIAGQLNAGQFNKGENWLIIEREKILTKADYGSDQNPGDLSSSEIKIVAYASMSVIVKGKQDEGIMSSLKVVGQSDDKTLGYEFYKPNAQTGIPMSKASKFGLVSFTMSANTFKEETETSSSSWSVGNTRYTQTTITTTTYEFPQLPSESWDYVMDVIYKDVVEFFKSSYNVDFVPIEDVIGTDEYSTLFPAEQELNKSVVKKSYKGTQRTTPQKISEIFGGLSTNLTSDNPQANMMKGAGDVDGLVSMELNLQVAANTEGNIILIPTMKISISGRDESNNSKLGRYVDGYVVRTTGEAFNGDKLKSSKEELLRVCSHEQIIAAMKSGIATLRAKEIEMGYDKIWSIGE